MPVIAEERSQPASRTDFQVPYWPQLDGFRTLSVMMIFIIHAWLHPGARPSPIGALNYLGVDCFFALSAFLITSLLIRERALFGNINYRCFFMRRSLRIWPLFYSVLLFAALLPLLNLSQALPRYTEFLAQQVLPAAFFYFNFSYPFNHDQLMVYSQVVGIPVSAILLPFWTLCVEEQFYAVWPLIMKHVPTLKVLAIGLCVAEVLTVLGRCVGHWVSFNLIDVGVPFQLYFLNTFCHLDPLLIGAMLAIVYHNKPQLFNCRHKYGIPLVCLLGGALFYLFSNLYLHFPTSSPMMIFDLTVTSFTCGLMLYLIMSWTPATKLFDNRAMAAVGRVSFAIYLFHNFVLTLLDKFFALVPLPDNQLLSFVLKVVVGFPITYAAALLSWKYLEGPCHRLKKKYERTALI